MSSMSNRTEEELKRNAAVYRPVIDEVIKLGGSTVIDPNSVGLKVTTIRTRLSEAMTWLAANEPGYEDVQSKIRTKIEGDGLVVMRQDMSSMRTVRRPAGRSVEAPRDFASELVGSLNFPADVVFCRSDIDAMVLAAQSGRSIEPARRRIMLKYQRDLDQRECYNRLVKSLAAAGTEEEKARVQAAFVEETQKIERAHEEAVRMTIEEEKASAATAATAAPTATSTVAPTA